MRGLSALAHQRVRGISTDTALPKQINLSKPERHTESSRFVGLRRTTGGQQSKQAEPPIHLDQGPRHSLVQTLERVEHDNNVALFRFKVCCHHRSAENQLRQVPVIVDSKWSISIDNGDLPLAMKFTWEKAQQGCTELSELRNFSQDHDASPRKCDHKFGNHLGHINLVGDANQPQFVLVDKVNPAWPKELIAARRGGKC